MDYHERLKYPIIGIGHLSQYRTGTTVLFFSVSLTLPYHPPTPLPSGT